MKRGYSIILHALFTLLLVQATTLMALERKAPDFFLPDEAGSMHALSNYKGKVLVLEWLNPECPFVQRHYRTGTMKQLAERYKGNEVAWLAINSTHYADSKQNAKWKFEHQLPYPLLLDQSGAVGKLYEAKTTPYMVVINRQGMIVYEGAIDSDPSGGEKNVQNYVQLALDELIADKPVSVAQTKSYGCSVKYAS